ncbi:hypothetical protein PM082_020140 [Marasmius tenuissimus]|nr:hypothetical protein PM082_020140 [Marasmius tenuissimus]
MAHAQYWHLLHSEYAVLGVSYGQESSTLDNKVSRCQVGPEEAVALFGIRLDVTP